MTLTFKPPAHREDGHHWVNVPTQATERLTIEHSPCCPHYLYNAGDGHPPFVTDYTCGVGLVQRDCGIQVFFRHINDLRAPASAQPLRPGRYPIGAFFSRPGSTPDLPWQGQLKVV